MTGGDVLVLLVLGAIVWGIVYSMIRSRKQGRSCCGDCSGCSGCKKE